MVDRIDAGVVSKPFFSQDVQGPKAIFSDGPARRAITKDLDTGCILNGSNRRSGIPHENSSGRLGINGSDASSYGRRVRGRARVLLAPTLETYVPPIRQRKRPLTLYSSNRSRHVVCSSRPATADSPTIPRDRTGKCLHHEIVFDVDTHYVRRWQDCSCLCPSLYFGQREIHQFPAVQSHKRSTLSLTFGAV